MQVFKGNRPNLALYRMALTSFSANIHGVGLHLFNSSDIADTFVVTVESLYIAFFKWLLQTSLRAAYLSECLKL